MPPLQLPRARLQLNLHRCSKRTQPALASVLRPSLPRWRPCLAGSDGASPAPRSQMLPSSGRMLARLTEQLQGPHPAAFFTAGGVAPHPGPDDYPVAPAAGHGPCH